MRHLFLAPLAGAFGEALQGVRLAADLVAAGHEVVFLAPSTLHALIGSAPVAYGRIDAALPHLDRELPALLRRQRCGSLVLVDVAGVGKVFGAYHLDAGALTAAGVPVVALDCWNLSETGLTWDYGPHTETIDAALLRFPRLVPAPLVRPGAAGAYAALPALARPSDAERAQARAELGVGADDRLVVWPSAIWQHPGAHADPTLRRVAGALPALVMGHLRALGPRVQLVHVGPVALAADETRGVRYRFMAQVAPRAFERLLCSADLLLSFNAVATSLATAVAARLPIVLGMTELDARTVGDAERALGPRLVPEVRAWIAASLPLYPIRAWPLGLHRFLAPLLAANPFYAAMRAADPLDAAAFVGACRELLFDPAAADALRQRQEEYHAAVRRLPSGPERLALALL